MLKCLDRAQKSTGAGRREERRCQGAAEPTAALGKGAGCRAGGTGWAWGKGELVWRHRGPQGR